MTIEEKLKEAFRLLKEVVDETGINLIDNYSYREYTATEILRSYLPSVKKTIGRTGDDANAIEEGYKHIEEKSGTKKGKTLTMTSFPDMLFDKQSDPARREYIYKYDGLSLSFFEYYKPYPTAVVFVPKEQVPKLHPLFKTKQDIKVADFNKRLAEGKNIGHDPIIIKLQEIVEAVGEKNLICWLHGERIDSVEFFHKLNNKQIKINQ
jgi:hypothetical protein